MSDEITAGAKDGAGRKSAASPLRLPPSSIFRREFSNALPAMASLAVLGILAGWLPTLSKAISSSRWNLSLDPGYFFYSFVAVGYMAALVLGVYCGAEEIENGTADFPRRLPVWKGRILVEKIAGSCAGFVAWAAMFLLLMLFAAVSVGLDASNYAANFLGRFGERIGGTLHPSFAWQIAPCLYGLGLAAGAWTGRVVLSAVIAGIALISYSAVSLSILGGGRHDLAFLLQWGRPPFWPAIVLSSAMAAIGFWRREAR